jgi:hypothetical protein
MFACIAGMVGGSAPKIAGCLANTQPSYIAFCLLKNSREVRTAQQLFNCITNGADLGSLVGNCTQALPINEKSRQTMTCVARAGDVSGSRRGPAISSSMSPTPSRSFRSRRPSVAPPKRPCIDTRSPSKTPTCAAERTSETAAERN